MVSKKLFLFLSVILLVGVVSAISIEEPQNITYSNIVNSFNWTNDVDNASVCLYSLNGGTNTSFDCGDSTVNIEDSIQGQNTLDIYMNDTDEANYSVSVSFWVDSIYPVLDYVTPVSSLIFTTLNTFNFQFWLNETNKGTSYNGHPARLKLWKPSDYVDYIWLQDLDMASEFLTDSVSHNLESGNLEEGNYSYNVTTKDTLNNLGYKEGIIIRDLTPPIYSNPENSSNIYGEGKVYDFNITWQDVTSWVNESSVLFIFDGNSETISREGDVYMSSVNDLAVGSYNYFWNATDMAGNEDTTGDLTFVVVQDTPVLNFLINTTWDSEIYGMTTNITGNTTSQILSSDCGLYRNDEFVGLSDVQTLGAGTYNYTFVCNETQNYTSSSISQNLTINPTSPSLTLNANKTITYGEAADVSASESNDNDEGCTYALYANGAETEYNPDNLTYDNGTIDYVYNTSGCQNYTAGSVSGWLAVNKAPQNIELIINDTDVDYLESFTVSCNGNLTRDGTWIGFNETVTESLGADTYEYVCYLEESLNYLYNESGGSVTVNKIASSVQLYLNGVADNLTVEYQELYLLEGNVSIGEKNATLYRDNLPILPPLNRSGLNISKYDLDVAGVYNITVVHAESQNYTASSETYFVHVNPRVIISSSGGSCKTIYSCVEWSEWTECVDGFQSRTCLDRDRVACRTGNTSKELDAGETRACTVPVVEETRGIQEGEPIVVPEPEAQQGLFARITGGTIGFAKSGTGIFTIITLLVLSAAYGVVHYKRKH